MTAPNSHRQAMSRFAARRAGLLGEAEERALAEHLARCESCRQAWEADASAAGNDESPAPEPVDTHVPAGVLAAWPRASGLLRGLERSMVRAHLERCADCRQELVLLGYSPTLEVVPALEWAPEEARGAEARARSSAPPRPKPAPSRPITIQLVPPRRDWVRWALGGWAAAASAAALLLVLNPGLMGTTDDGGSPGAVAPPPPAPPPGVLSAPPAPQPPAGDVPTSSLTLAEPALRLRGVLRSGTGSPPTRRIAAGSTHLPILVDPLDLPDDFLVEVTLRCQADGATMRTTVPNRALPSGRIVLTREGQPLVPGTYVLRLRGGPAPDALLPEPEVAEYRFVLEIRPPDARP